MTFFLLNSIILISSIILIEILKKKESVLIIFDKPDNSRKIHSKSTALLGGLIILINLIIALIFSIFTLEFNNKLILILAFFYFGFFIVGFIDDKISLSPLKKTFIIFFILIICLPLDQNLIVKKLIFKDLNIVIFLNEASLFFTIFCIYFFFNLFNFSDGVNGQSISVSLFWILIFFFNGGLNQNLLLTFSICLTLLLIYNIKNDLFLGNSGSAILSAILSSFFILDYNFYGTIKCDEILLLLFFPAIDSLRISFERLFKGVSPFKADKNHFHHLIIQKNINKNYIFLIYLILAALPYILSLLIFKTYISLFISLILYFIILLYLKKYK